MNESEIIENNKLIAEFMGWEYRQIKDDWYGVYCDNQLRWNGTWQQIGGALLHLGYERKIENLWTVMEKIEDLDLSSSFYKWKDLDDKERSNFNSLQVDIDRKSCVVWLNLELDPAQVVGGDIHKRYETKMEALYNAVIGFIKWYNDLLKQEKRS